MHPENSREALEIFDASLRLATEKRGAFIAEACGGDEELEQEVRSLLEAADEAEDFMRQPLLRLPHDDGT